MKSFKNRLEKINGDLSLRYVRRVASASPATGSYSIHIPERKKIMNAALPEETGEISAASTAQVTQRLAPTGTQENSSPVLKRQF